VKLILIATKGSKRCTVIFFLVIADVQKEGRYSTRMRDDADATLTAEAAWLVPQPWLDTSSRHVISASGPPASASHVHGLSFFLLIYRRVRRPHAVRR
jgi:hypothetical protein